MPRKWLVFIAVAAIFFFASATTFQSLGIAVFAMQGEFHWSEAAAGGAFLTLGLVCAATAMFPVFFIPRIGARWTMVGGGLLLALGFLIASLTTGLAAFYLAMGFLGFGFSLVANASGIYLIAGWFADRSPRVIGLYLMSGTISGAAGPPVAEALLSTNGGWRLYWLVMTGVAVAVALLCAVFIGEPPSAEPEGGAGIGASEGWHYRQALQSPQFIVIAAAMVITQACLLIVGSVIAPHFDRLGWPSGLASRILGLQALIGTAGTGVSGWLSSRVDPKAMLTGGLLALGTGMILFTVAGNLWLVYGFSLIFGIGWSVTCLAVTVLLIRYFGDKGGTAALSTIWMFCGAATAGPWAVGLAADLTGSFAPALGVIGLLTLPVAIASMFMTAPRRDLAEPLVLDYRDG